ncbi:AraC family transcriptional regulator [Olivibacter ginsenosidimutans]|uniref:AraC family transcriptional regulator n=1 Tax=Olivibacter ginsenosidimutans TaxID=1176537 RepID=A0ABP9BSC3_9SPHI
MHTFHKYLAINPLDQKWGLYVLNAGFGPIRQALHYPSTQHPDTYYFDWRRGRILTEYQLIYITAGEGIFESEHSGTRQVREGSVIFLFPNEWHRYKPNEATGWNEYWIGFNGPVADQIIQNDFFNPSKPVIEMGYKDDIVDLYVNIAERIKEAQPGFQQIISGQTLHLLGKIYALSKGKFFSSPPCPSENMVNKAKLLLREHLDEAISIEQIAEQLQVSYSQFRKLFKKHTGYSPGQYFIQLKIEKAKHYLNHSDRMIKDIAYELGFDSCFYFSKLFKEKTGLSPEFYRKEQQFGQ